MNWLRFHWWLFTAPGDEWTRKRARREWHQERELRKSVKRDLKREFPWLT